MTNLLRANFFRMRRDHVFWTCFGTVLACSVVFVFFWCREDVQRGFQVKLEQHYFNMAMSLGFFIAMFAAMFLNAEYSDGTIRNKLTVGCIRREVYLANFLTVLTASLFFTAAWLIGGCVGIPMVGPWGFGLGGLAFHVLIAVGSTAAFAAIFTSAFSFEAVGGDRMLFFDERRTTGSFGRDDLRREHNLAGDSLSRTLERRVKAFVQQYFDRLERSDFTVE